MLHLYLSLSTLPFAYLKKTKQTCLNEKKAKLGSLFGQNAISLLKSHITGGKLNENQI